MSGIYIKGISKPSCCGACPFHKPLYHTQYCTILNKNCAPFGTMKGWCPLIPVPPHGRLIDGDEAKKAANLAVDLAFSSKTKLRAAMAVASVIISAPTIIPASKEGE